MTHLFSWIGFKCVQKNESDNNMLSRPEFFLQILDDIYSVTFNQLTLCCCWWANIQMSAMKSLLKTCHCLNSSHINPSFHAAAAAYSWRIICTWHWTMFNAKNKIQWTSVWSLLKTGSKMMSWYESTKHTFLKVVKWC